MKLYKRIIQSLLIKMHFLSDKKFLKILYMVRMNKKLDLTNPNTFTEKLQWLKIHDRKKNYTSMVDKYEVKKYVANIIGDNYIIPTIDVYDRFDEIDFEAMPQQFVMKCTHDSGGLVIVRNKNELNICEARKKINKCLKRNFYYNFREWPYKDVRPRIIIEKYMQNSDEQELKDYKFYCFNGEPKYCQVIADRQVEETIDFYDMNWKHQAFNGLNNCPMARKKHDKPKTFNKMKKFAKELSHGIAFVRVDFYEINDKLYFGEITFFPAGGFGEFSPKEWDKRLGDMINLDKDKNEI